MCNVCVMLEQKKRPTLSRKPLINSSRDDKIQLATTGPPDLDNYVGIFVYMLDFVYLCTDNQSFNKQSK